MFRFLTCQPDFGSTQPRYLVIKEELVPCPNMIRQRLYLPGALEASSPYSDSPVDSSHCVLRQCLNSDVCNCLPESVL